MANPFKRFRKNRKAGLAFLGVVCIITFVLGGTGVSIFSSCAQTRPDIAVETKAGNLTYQDLEALRNQRSRINDVMQPITGHPQFFGNSDNQSVFNTWLKAQKAREMGLEISNDAITNFLATEGNLRSLQNYLRGQKIPGLKNIERMNFQTALAHVLDHNHMVDTQFFGALHDELLARRLDEMFNFQDLKRYQFERALAEMGFLNQAPQPPDWPVIPSEQKEYFDFFQRQVHAEVLPVPVKEFVSQVQEEPTEEQVKAFFDLYKRRSPNPESDEPGFMLEHLAQFQFFQLPADRFDTAARAAVTPGQIRQRYERIAEAARKDENHRFRFDRKKWLDELPKKEDEKEKKKPEAKGASLDPPRNPTDDAAPSPEYPVAFQAEDAKTPAAEPAKPEAGDEKAKVAGDTKPGDTKPGTTGGFKLPAEKSKDPKRKPPRLLNDVFRDLKIPEDIREGDAPLIKPLWQVEEELRNEHLAPEHAQADMDRLANYLKEAMTRHGEAWHKWTDRSRSRGDAKEPANPLNDPRERAKLIEDAWARLLKEKQEEWTKNLTEEKDRVAAELKRLAEEAKLSPEEFRRQAEETQNDTVLQLLADEKRLADVSKAVADLREAWLSAFNKSGPLEAPDPGGMSHIALSFHTTSPNLSEREFAERNYPLVPRRFGRFNEQEVRESIARLYRTAQFTPATTTASSGRGDEFVYWMIKDRPSAVPAWDEKTGAEEVTPKYAIYEESDRAAVRLKYKEIMGARDKAKERAEEIIAQTLKPQLERFVPFKEVQRYFKVDSSGTAPAELLESDHQYLQFDSDVSPSFRIVVQDYKDGGRKTAGKKLTGPLEAPPPGHASTYGNLADAQKQARHIAESHRRSGALVIVGKSVGTLDQETVYRGVAAYYWTTEKTAAKEAAAKQQLALLEWPGILEDKEFQVGPTAGKPGVTRRGDQLQPFTAASALSRRGFDLANLEHPGEEFVRTAFKLKRGEFGVAFNDPKTIAYIILATDFDYGLYPDDFSAPNREPATLFTSTPVGSMRHAAATSDLPQLYNAWLKALHEEYRVKEVKNVFAIRE
jgi:hypothetical protein